MAKWGEGDPRWIVQSREDGKNVNGWHWTEQDFSSWTKQKFVEYFGDKTLDTPKAWLKFTDVTMTGEVSVNTRKKKLIILYELHVTMKWDGLLKSDNSKGNGKVEMPYISDENDPTDFELKVTVEGDSKSLDSLKQEVRTQAMEYAKEKVPQILKELRAVAEERTNMAPKDAPSAKVLDKSPEVVVKSLPSLIPSVDTSASKPKTQRFVSITQKEKFVCAPRDIFECLTEPNRVKAYAGGDAEMNGEKGGKFKLFGGSVTGENVTVEFPTKLVQKWRFSSWPENVFSTVTITLDEKDGKTLLNLNHEGIPEDDKEHTEEGWKNNFWVRIRGIFGYGGLK